MSEHRKYPRLSLPSTGPLYRRILREVVSPQHGPWRGKTPRTSFLGVPRMSSIDIWSFSYRFKKKQVALENLHSAGMDIDGTFLMAWRQVSWNSHLMQCVGSSLRGLNTIIIHHMNYIYIYGSMVPESAWTSQFRHVPSPTDWVTEWPWRSIFAIYGLSDLALLWWHESLSPYLAMMAPPITVTLLLVCLSACSREPTERCQRCVPVTPNKG